LHFYSCKCSQCDATTPASLGGVGKTSHGPVWISSILAVAGEVQARINWQLDVTLNRSIAYEMKTSDWEPTLEQVTGWELSLPLMRSHRSTLFEEEKAKEKEEARKLEEARKARDQYTKETFRLPADATEEQLKEEIARRVAQSRQEKEQKAQEEEREEQEREALARQMAQARKEQEEKEQKQREREKARREAEQRALRAFGLPADYLQNQDEQEVARQMAENIRKQNAKTPRRQHSQDADPKKDEVVSLKDQVLRRFRSGVSKKKR